MLRNKNYKVFVVEDNDWFNKMIAHSLSQNPDIIVKSFFNGNDLLKALHEVPDVITLDYKLPDTTGNVLLNKIKEFNPKIEVIIISEQDDIEIAVELLKQGAYDYLVKSPDMHSRLFNNVSNLLKKSKLEDRIEYLQNEVERKFNFSNTIIGQSKAILDIFSLLQKASSSNINVSITGETGTGKELVAKAIHYNSDRKNKPFVAVNMAAIPKELVESELFGHEKGAFTGAIEKRKGKFAEANGGTIFLDEIAEMDLSLQTKLLRVLQEREVTPVGSNTAIKIDCKLIIATHQDLKKLVEEKKFREDLFFRIMGLKIHLPPLRDRGHDVLLIAKKHIEEFCQSNQMAIKSLSEKACQKLLSYPFPGNVRELKTVIEVAVVMSDNHEIEDHNIMFQHSDLISQMSNDEHTLREYTFKIIIMMLTKYHDDVQKVSKILDISPATIYRILKEFNHKL
jgi:two-component system response regulator AtoC